MACGGGEGSGRHRVWLACLQWSSVVFRRSQWGRGQRIEGRMHLLLQDRDERLEEEEEEGEGYGREGRILHAAPGSRQL